MEKETETEEKTDETKGHSGKRQSKVGGSQQTRPESLTWVLRVESARQSTATSKWRSTRKMEVSCLSLGTKELVTPTSTGNFMETLRLQRKVHFHCDHGARGTFTGFTNNHVIGSRSVREKTKECKISIKTTQCVYFLGGMRKGAQGIMSAEDVESFAKLPGRSQASGCTHGEQDEGEV